jgi:inner membrane protein
MLNIRGADLLWPSPIRVVMPGNRNWRMEVGSKAEMALLTSLIVACLALYPVSGLGFRAGLQQLFKKAGTQWYTLELEAIDNLTLEHIKCQCPILGVWQSGLIVLYDGKPRAVGESQVHHNLHPTSAKLIEGEPLEVVSYKVDMRGKHLAWLLERIDRQRTYYLMGEMLVGKELKAVGDINLYRPADFDGKVLHLHYAREQELGPYLHMVAVQGEVYVQFWLRPGEAPVGLQLGKEGPEEVIPEVLRSYL